MSLLIIVGLLKDFYTFRDESADALSYHWRVLLLRRIGAVVFVVKRLLVLRSCHHAVHDVSRLEAENNNLFKP